MNKIKALIYCRVATVRQERSGPGLDGQEHSCRKYARDHDYEVEAVFKDSCSGISDPMQRPAMSALLKYSDKNPSGRYIVIFDGMGRLARNVVFYQKLITEFKIHGLVPECTNCSETK